MVAENVGQFCVRIPPDAARGNGVAVRLRPADSPTSGCSEIFWLRLRSRDDIQQTLMRALQNEKDAKNEKRFFTGLEQLAAFTRDRAEDSKYQAGVVVQLATVRDAKKFLRIAPNGAVDCEAGGGPWGFFYALPTPRGVMLRSLANTTTGKYLATPSMASSQQQQQQQGGSRSSSDEPLPFVSSTGIASLTLPNPATCFEWGTVAADGRTPVQLVNGTLFRLIHVVTGFVAPQQYRAESVSDDELAALYRGAGQVGDWRTACGLRPGRTSAEQKVGFFRFRIAAAAMNPVASRLGFTRPHPVGAGNANETRLRILPEFTVDEKGGAGPWATWRVDLAPGSNPPIFSLQVVGHMWQGNRAFLAPPPPPPAPHQQPHQQQPAPPFGVFRAQEPKADDEAERTITLCDEDLLGMPRWIIESLPEGHDAVQRLLLGDANSSLFFSDPAADSVLPPPKMAEFLQNGFVRLDSAVARRLTDRARHYVNNLLGQGPTAWHEDPDHRGEGPVKYVLKHGNHHTLLATIYQSAVSSAIQRLMGGQGMAQPIGGAQLAIRFPVDASVPELDTNAVPGGSLQRGTAAFAEPAPINVKHCGPSGWHIDGMGREKHIPFGLLVLVALSDQDTEGHGNFTVWRGQHRNPAVRSWYHSGVGLRPPNNAPVTEAQRVAYAEFERRKPKLEPVKPEQVCLKAGDVALVHPLLPHSVGVNTSPDPRYTIIMRFQSAQQATLEEAARNDPRFEPYNHLSEIAALYQR